MIGKLQELNSQNEQSLDGINAAMINEAKMNDVKILATKNKAIKESQYLIENSLAKPQTQESPPEWNYIIQHQTINCPCAEINLIKISKDRKLIICVGINSHNAGIIHVFDPKTGEQVGSDCVGHSGFILSIDTSQDSKMIASGSYDGTARFWNMYTGEQIGEPCGHRDHINAVRFSPNQQTLSSICADGFIRIWNVADQRQLIKCAIGVEQFYSCNMFFLTNETIMISSFQLRSLRLWNTQTGRLTQIYKGRAQFITYSPNRKLIGSILNYSIQIQDAKKFKLITRSKFILSRVFKFSPDSKSMIFQSLLAVNKLAEKQHVLKLLNITDRSVSFRGQHTPVTSLQIAPVQGYIMFGTLSKIQFEKMI